MSGDAGRQLLECLRESLAPAPPYLASGEDAFSWWPHACAQHVAVTAEVQAAGERWWRVQVRHDLLRGVDGTAAQFAAISEWNVRHPGLSALRWDGEANGVALVAGADVRAGDVDAVARLLATAALLQLADAARDAGALAAALGGVPDASSAPDALTREDADALTEAWRDVAAGGVHALDVEALLAPVAAVSPPPWRRVRADAGGLHAELPCPRPGQAAADAPGADVAMLHLLASEPHPLLGAGLLCVLRLPAEAEPVEGRRFATAALLNEGESHEWTGTHALGAWCVHPAAGLSHVAFFPAMLVDEALPAALAWGAGSRARWARGFLERVAALRSQA